MYFTLILYLLVVANDTTLLTFLNPIALIIGSLLPDCDHKRAPAGKILPLWAIKGIKHRGITHTIYANVFVGLLGMSLISLNFGVSIFVGYLLHLLLDSTTPMGVNWLNVRKKTHPQTK